MGLEIARELLLKGDARHVTVLLLLLRARVASMSDLRHALAKRGKRAGYREVLATVMDLRERGLIEEDIVGVLSKRKVRIYRLTEKGLQVASTLANLLGISELPPSV